MFFYEDSHPESGPDPSSLKSVTENLLSIKFWPGKVMVNFFVLIFPNMSSKLTFLSIAQANQLPI